MNTEQLDSGQTAGDVSQPTYFSYLLRLWRDGNGGETVWRVSLENARSREQHGFKSLEELVAYLSKSIGLE